MTTLTPNDLHAAEEHMQELLEDARHERLVAEAAHQTGRPLWLADLMWLFRRRGPERAAPADEPPGAGQI